MQIHRTVFKKSEFLSWYVFWPYPVLGMHSFSRLRLFQQKFYTSCILLVYIKSNHRVFKVARSVIIIQYSLYKNRQCLLVRETM